MTNELQFSLDQCSSANVGAGRSKRQPRSLAFRRTRSRRFYAVVRFAPQATANDITNFLGAHKATVVEGPLAGQLYRIRLSQAKLPKEEVNKIVSQMQLESKIVDFIVAKE